MKVLIKSFAFVLFWLVASVQLMFSQGVLIFELSDPDNAPIQNLPISISGKGVSGRDTSFVLTTDTEGRVVATSIPVGDYVYSLDYGDYGQGKFTVKPGGYTWIDLDYRSLVISFVDEENNPQQGRSLVLYKEFDNGDPDFEFDKRFSKADGMISFVLPEGNYHYVSNGVAEFFELNDENKTMNFNAQAGLITHNTYFRFVRADSTVVKTWCQSIYLLMKDKDGNFTKAYGSIDPYSDLLVGDYYLIDTTLEYLSCADGEYVYTVNTKSYGTLSDTFVIKSTDDIMKHVVDIILPADTSHGGSGGDQGGSELDTLPHLPMEEIPVVDVTLVVLSAKDSITPLPGIVNWYSKEYKWTNSRGESYYKLSPGGYYDIHVANEIFRDVHIVGDTTIYYYLEDPHYSKVKFNFYLGVEKFDPSSIRSITLYRARGGAIYEEYRYDVLRGLWNAADSLFHYDDVFSNAVLGEYMYEFYIAEKNYNGGIRGSFDVVDKDTIVEVDIHLKTSHRIEVHVLDADKNVMNNRYVFVADSASNYTMMLTDTAGVADTLMFDGHYKVMVSNQMQEVDLVRDTVLYFSLKEVTQNVNVKFLHDGKIVYPQISNLDFYTSKDSALYSRMISTYYSDLDGTGEAWVFEDAVPCESGDYYFNYKLNDYNYTNATFKYDFNVAGPGSADTTVYVVVPVKRTVTITIKDAIGALVKGVNANIYKYDEEGVLSEELVYDFAEHGPLKTNTDGIVFDHLLPGRYQIRILDIVRDFVVTDYDLQFEIRSGMEMVDVTYYVLYESSKEPVEGVSLEIHKGDQFYTLQKTDSDGAVYTQCEPADYTWYLNYSQQSGTVEVDRKRTVFIYVPDPVLIKSMNLSTCQYVNHNDTIALPLTIAPDNATMKDVVWSVDNEVLARVFADGKLITNNIGLDGYFTIEAMSTDGSGKKASLKMYVGDSIETSLSLTIDGGKTDAVLNSDSIKISVAKVDQFERYYIYQSSTDSVTWTNAYGPTQDKDISLPADLYANSATYFRAVSATNTSDVLALASNRPISCAAGLVSNAVVNRVFDLTPLNWSSVVCASGSVVLAIDSANIAALPEGYFINWYLMKNAEAGYEKIDATNKDSVVLSLDSVVTIKVAIERDSVELKKYEQKMTVVKSVRFNIVSNDSIYCEGEEALLSLDVQYGEPTSILWSNGSTEKSINVAADQTQYSVTVGTQSAICPTVTELFNFKIDQLADLALKADKSSICKGSGDTVRISVVNPLAYDSIFSWTDRTETDSFIVVVPTKTTTYTVKANSKYGKCGSKEASVQVFVDTPVEFAIEPSDSIACVGSDVTFSVNVTKGKAGAYLWNNGSTDSTIVAEVVADSVFYGVSIESIHKGCPVVSDSIRLKVETPVQVYLSASENLICYTRTDSVKLTIINPSNAAISAYSWGDSSMTKTSYLKVLPKTSTVYTVAALSKYGRCRGAESSVAVNVVEPIDASISADMTSVCQTGDSKVVLTAQSKAGVETPTFIWWDGVRSTDSVRVVSPDTTTTYWVATSNSACVQAGNDSVTVVVAKPATVDLTTANKVYEYGGTIDFSANTSSKVVGPYTWISVDEQGEETVINVTNTSSYSEMPSGDANYYVKVENGACPTLTSELIKTHLVDNIVIPTVFTPHELNGENDDFMPGYEVVIYDRYGNVIADSKNGWDGDYKGDVADAGVYIYVLTLKDGRVKKGTIEVYRK